MRLASWGHGSTGPWANFNELHLKGRVRDHAATDEQRFGDTALNRLDVSISHEN
jgi:hypothetical protein